MHRRLVPGSERHHELADYLCAYNLKVRAWRSHPRGRGTRPCVKKQESKRYPYSLRKEQMAAVVWTTPLGLPIVQPYRKSQAKADDDQYAVGLHLRPQRACRR
jgi:hypothetical protein